MSGIKRFDCEAVENSAVMEMFNPDGEYVLFTDHEQVVADKDKTIQACVDVHYADVSKFSELVKDRDREIDRLRAELAAKSKDAERYAWLRDRAGQDGDRVEIFIDNESYAPGHLDAQVDDAMGEQA